MQLPTLNQFIKESEGKWPRNAYVRQRGCSELYVRRSRRHLGGVWVDGVLDIARIEVRYPGRGLFTRLTNQLLARGIPLFIECVLNERFATNLSRMGFTRVDHSCVNGRTPPSFYKLPS